MLKVKLFQLVGRVALSSLYSLSDGSARRVGKLKKFKNSRVVAIEQRSPWLFPFPDDLDHTSVEKNPKRASTVHAANKINLAFCNGLSIGNNREDFHRRLR